MLAFALLSLLAPPALAQSGGSVGGKTAAALPIPTLPGIAAAKNPQDVAGTLVILFLVTILSLAPAILVLMTPFTRIMIVLSFLRQAIGAPQIPPNQVLIGLALFLTLNIMAPQVREINDHAVQPYLAGKIQFAPAVEEAQKPLRQFMVRQTYKNDLQFFLKQSKLPVDGEKNALKPDQLPMTVVVPAFVISELKTAFLLGFFIYVPFLVIDLVVSSLLMSMGMMMLPPTVISLPAKILLFVLADGWHLIIASLAQSFR